MNPYDPPAECPIDAPTRTSTRELDMKSLRGLRIASHIIRALAVFSGVASVFSPFILLSLLPERFLDVLSQQPQIVSQCIELGMPVFFIVVAFGCFKRPSWGRFTGVLCSGLMTCLIPFGTVFGLIGLFTFAGCEALFGDEKYIHEDLDLEWQNRKKKFA